MGKNLFEIETMITHLVRLFLKICFRKLVFWGEKIFLLFTLQNNTFEKKISF